MRRFLGLVLVVLLLTSVTACSSAVQVKCPVCGYEFTADGS